MKIYWSENNPDNLIRKGNFTSLGKSVDDESWKPSDKWCKNVILSEHSTTELVHLVIEDEMRADVISHLVRSTVYHPRHVVGSWREDWTGKPRPRDPSTLRPYLSEWSPKALITMMRDRLCFKAMRETKEKAEEIKRYLLNSDDNLMRAVGWACVPQCIYRYGCPFSKTCGDFGRMSFDIRDRYDAYAEEFI